MGEFSPPFFLSPLVSLLMHRLQPGFGSITLLQNIHHPFQYPGSAPDLSRCSVLVYFTTADVQSMVEHWTFKTRFQKDPFHKRS